MGRHLALDGGASGGAYYARVTLLRLEVVVMMTGGWRSVSS